MELYNLSPAAGSTKEAFRKGRGHGSGNGKTGGRGHKGQKARSGGGVRVGFEGGQLPLARRNPKRGVKHIYAKGILSKCAYGYKVLGNGSVTKKVTVQAAAFSQSAKEAIEAAGGKAEVV